MRSRKFLEVTGMEVTRYVCYEPDVAQNERPDWTWVEFSAIKIKGRKVFRLYGLEELRFVCVKQSDDPQDESYTFMFYSVGFPPTASEPLIEIVATKNNREVSKVWSTFSLNLVGRVTNANIKLKQLKQTEVPAMELAPRCPVMSRELVVDLPKQDTKGKGDNPLEFLEGL
jgi:hypothetical protein